MFRLQCSYLSWEVGSRCNKANHFKNVQQPHAILFQRVFDYSLKQTRGCISSLISTLNMMFSVRYTKYELIQLISITLWKLVTINVNSNTKYQLW
jgi:hypothetical protein